MRNPHRPIIDTIASPGRKPDVGLELLETIGEAELKPRTQRLRTLSEPALDMCGRPSGSGTLLLSVRSMHSSAWNSSPTRSRSTPFHSTATSHGCRGFPRRPRPILRRVIRDLLGATSYLANDGDKLFGNPLNHGGHGDNLRGRSQSAADAVAERAGAHPYPLGCIGLGGFVQRFDYRVARVPGICRRRSRRRGHASRGAVDRRKNDPAKVDWPRELRPVTGGQIHEFDVTDASELSHIGMTGGDPLRELR